MEKNLTVEDRKKLAADYFQAGYNCCQSVAMAFSDVLGLENGQVARLASGFGGGMGRMREVCGTVSGMVMVAGALCPADNVSDKEAKTANYAMVQEFAARFREMNGSIICRELLGLGQKKDTPVPSDRTPEYYRKRPCGELCAVAAGIVAEKMESMKKQDTI